MNPAEALTLCRLAKAACPQQAIDEYTPDAWFELMSHLRFEDCKEALFAVTRRQPFVAPAEIIAEVKRVREKRLADFGPFEPPPGVEGDREWFIETRTAIADGTLTRENYKPQLGNRTMPALDGVFRRVDEEAS